MSYIQLVAPDLSVVGHIAYCLEYADNVAGLSNGEYSAWIAWQNTQFPHTDPIPTDVAVPCWFEYYSGGVNLGHVVWSIQGQQFYSSPYKQTIGHNVMNSIAEVEQLYGVKYVGWSEDISGLKVVTEGDLPMGVKLMGAPVSTGSPNGRIDVFGRGSDDGLWQKYFGKDGWSSWVRVGSGVASSPSVPQPYTNDRIDVFFTGGGGDLVHTYFNGKGWTPNESLGKPEE